MAATFRRTALRTGALIAVTATAFLAFASGARVRSLAEFAGVWIVDSNGRSAGDVYAELRVVRATENDLRLTMSD